jgi:hypothetical protein
MTGEFKPLIFCDGEEVARIANGTYYELEAPPGLHKCTAESLQRPAAIEVNVIAGKSSYVHVKLLQGWTDHAALANTTQDEYDKHKAKLKPLKEWSRAALVKGEADSAEANPPSPIKQPKKDKHSGKFGDLAVRVNRVAMTPSHYSKDRDEVAVFVTTENTGKGVICADLAATLNTSFGLQYHAAAPRIREMLPAETADGSYKFEIKHGVQPFEIVIRLESARYDGGVRITSIRCGSDSPFKDVFIPDEIRLDIGDLPIGPGQSE